MQSIIVRELPGILQAVTRKPRAGNCGAISRAHIRRVNYRCTMRHTAAASRSARRRGKNAGAFERAADLVGSLIKARRAERRPNFINDLVTARDQGDKRTDRKLFD